MTEVKESESLETSIFRMMVPGSDSMDVEFEDMALAMSEKSIAFLTANGTPSMGGVIFGRSSGVLIRDGSFASADTIDGMSNRKTTFAVEFYSGW
jgi:hypothetical protein